MSRITPGTAIRPEPLVIDLARPHPEGGMDPEAGLALTEMDVTGRVMLGHTASLADPDAPILVRETDINGPPDSGLGYAEARCPRCIAKVTICRSDAETMIVLEHRPGCRAFRKMLRQAGR